jgi:ABC-2 type transport system ATP-binding protein
LSYVIETENLGRTYRSYKKSEGVTGSIKGFWKRQHIDKVALSSVSLKVEPGQVIGLVGANGAGKTTLLKILSGLIHPSTGKATVLGFKPWERKHQFLKQISILLGQKNQLWWDITPRDSYALLSRIYDLDIHNARKRVDELAKMLDCTHVLDIQLRRLSLGERMKMEIIGSLLHEPKVLFLDEPTIGLDIVAQGIIREFIANYVKSKGPTIVLTSHYMDDIAKLANKLLLISKGQLVYEGSVPDFIEKSQSSRKLIYRLEGQVKENSVQFHTHELKGVLNQISSQGEIEDLKIEEIDFEDIIHGFLEKESRSI